jgi:fucose 4-O-acetylase-like acetyltransferase
MMLLGFVAHAAPIYGTGPYADPLELLDPSSQNPTFDILFDFVHCFRVPTFFLVAGYFGALLFYRRGRLYMLRNRFDRILLPLIGGVIIICPLNALAFVYSFSKVSGMAEPFDYACGFVVSGDFLPFRPDHLWFLYYLVLYSAFACGVFTILEISPRVDNQVVRFSRQILLNRRSRILVFGGLIFLALTRVEPTALASASFEINLTQLASLFIFYGFGWMIYRTDSLADFRSYCWFQLGTASLLLALSIWFAQSDIAPKLILVHFCRAFAVALYVLGFLALFLRYFEFESSTIDYLVDASYWVYIVHLPILVFASSLTFKLGLPPTGKFFLLILISAPPSFLSYHLLVRDKPIGRFLSGNRSR